MFTHTHNRISHIILTIIMGVLVCVLSMVSHTTNAAPSYTMNYQGKLTNASNVAVANGTYNMRFWITTSPTIATTSALWSEELTGTNKVQVTNGLFSIMLGSTTPLTGIDWNQPLYLGVEVGGTTTPAWDGEMSPRKILGTVPSAFEAKNTQTFAGIATTSFLRSDQADTASGLLTFTGGLISNSSTTITDLTTLTATTTNLVINGQRFTNLLGSGLTNSSNALTCATANSSTFGCLLAAEWTIFNNKVSSTSIDTSAELASLLTDETGTGLAVFGTNPLLSGFRSNASSTIGDGTATGGLTVFGNSTTTGSARFATTTISYINNIAYVDGLNFPMTSTGVQLAIDSLGSNGGKVVLAEGTYSITSTINIPARVLLEGAGASSTILYLANGANTSVISVTGNDVTIRDLAIEGNNTNNVGTIYGINIGSSASRTIIDRLRVYDIEDSGVYALSSGTQISFSNFDANTVAIENLHGSLRVTRCTFTGNATGILHTGFMSTDAIYSNNYFNQNTSYDINLNEGGITTLTGNSFHSENAVGQLNVVGHRNTIVGNIFYNTNSGPVGGVRIAGDYNIFADNSIVNPHTNGYGVWIESTADNTQVYDNQISATRPVVNDGTNTTFTQAMNGNFGIGTTSPLARLFVQDMSSSTATLFTIASSTGASLLTVLSSGNVGIGTTSPYANLTIAGSLGLTGAFYDRTASAGTNGYVLQTTGTGVQWVATSTLGFSSGSSFSDSASLAALLSDETGTGYAVFSASPVFTGGAQFAGIRASASSTLGYASSTALTVSGNGYIGGLLGIGTTTPSAQLSITGTAGNTQNLITIASSTGSTTLAVLASGDVEVPGNIISAGINWMARTAVSNQWNSVTYGNGLFVAVAQSGTGNRIMTSPDGVNWTARTSVADLTWKSVTYGNGLFVAVSWDGAGNNVMTSPDGITWTSRSAAGNNDYWNSVTYGNGLFVAVGLSGGDRVMTSPDGITWTIGSAAGNDDAWHSVTYGNGLFVAVGDTNDRVMTSQDGIIWNARTPAEVSEWHSVTYGNGLFVAVAGSGTNRAMTSPDGITWTSRSVAGDDETWESVTYGNGLFVAVGLSGGDRAMTSPDGITWTARSAAGNDDTWESVTYGNGLFVAVGTSGDRVITSGKTYTNAFAYNNIYQGGMSVLGGAFNIGTTTATTSAYASNILNITSTTGISLLTMLQSGYMGIGSSTPSRLLTVAGDTYISGNITAASSTLGYASTTALTVSGNSYFNFASSTYASTTGFTASNLALLGTLRDGANSVGTNGYVLQTTGTGVQWVATSTLGFGSSFSTSAQLAALLSDETGTGLAVFGTNPLLSGFRSNASSTIGDGTATGGLTISGNSTTTGDAYFGGDISINTGITDGYVYWNGQKFLTASTTTYNTFLGLGAGTSTQTGFQNTSVGYNAMQANTESRNTAVGAYAGFLNVNGANNTFIGNEAGKKNISGQHNTFVGDRAGYSNTGDKNSFFGQSAGYLTTTGFGNSFFGRSSGESNIIGSHNSAFGSRALYLYNGTGTIAMGYQAGDALTNGNSNIIIGYNNDFANASTSFGLNIGNLIYGTGVDGEGTTLSSGNIGIGSSTPSRKLTVAGDGYFSGNITAASSTLGYASSTALTVSGNSYFNFASSTYASTTGLTASNLSLLGTLRDGANSAGTNGYVLQTTGTGVQWVATSTLGFGSSFSTSAQLAALLSDETGTGLSVFGTNPLLSGFRSNASSTIGDGTGTGGLTIYGGATTTGNAYFAGNVGVGTTTLSALKLDIADATYSAGASSVLNMKLYSGGASSGGAYGAINIDNSLGGNGYRSRYGVYSTATQYGVIGRTTGDANSYIDLLQGYTILGPSGVTGVTNGTSGGNAINGGSYTITSAALTYLAHAQSAFTGTGLMMNFAQGSGSFTGKYLSFLNNNVEKFAVDSTGAYTATAGTTTHATTTNLKVSTLRDNANSVGSNGYVLQSNGSTVAWVATSSLGITGGGSSFSDSAGLAALLSDETGTGLSVFGTNPLLSGFRSNASSTIGDGTATGGLTIYGGATTTGNAYFGGKVGVGGNSPIYALDIVGTGIDAIRYRKSGSGADIRLTTEGWGVSPMLYMSGGDQSTATVINSRGPLRIYTGDDDPSGSSAQLGFAQTGGRVGVGTTTPSAKLSVHALAGETNSQLFTIASSTASATSTLFTVLNNGYVGIGTVNPTNQLHIYSTTANATAVVDSTWGDAVLALNAQPSGTSNQWNIVSSGTSGKFTIDDAWNGGTALTVEQNPGSYSLYVKSGGNVGIGTTTPSRKLTVVGDGYFSGNITAASSTLGYASTTALTVSSNSYFNFASSTYASTTGLTASNLSLLGTFRDSTNSAGTNGYVLQTTGTGVQWVATSSLGITGGGSSFSDSAGLAALLSDETGTGYAVFSASPVFTGGAQFAGIRASASSTLGYASSTALTVSGNSYFNFASSTYASTTGLTTQNAYVGNMLGIGTVSPSSNLTIQGSGTTNPFLISSSTGSTSLAVLASGDVEVPGNLVSAGIAWTERVSPVATWMSVAYGNGRFVAVGGTGTAMVSSDGVNWATSTSAVSGDLESVTYGNGLFVAVASNGTNQVMTSIDGINWTARVAAGAKSWKSVTYGKGLFVAVAWDASNGIMTSPDGIVWTLRTPAEQNYWMSVTYGGGLFVAVCEYNSSFGNCGKVMTSSDGINWTMRTLPQAGDWHSITYGNGMFVMVSYSGSYGVSVSTDGVSWTAQAGVGFGHSITYGNGLFVRAGLTGRTYSSSNGREWIDRRYNSSTNTWRSITYGDGMFVAVSSDGTNRVMTSGKTQTNALAHNNIYQGGMSVLGGAFNIGTTTASTSAFAQNILNIASTTGTSLLTMLKTGYVGIGSSTPSRLLTVAGDGYFSGNITVASSTLGYASSTALTAGNAYFTNSSLGYASTTALTVAGNAYFNFASSSYASTTGVTATTAYVANLLMGTTTAQGLITMNKVGVSGAGVAGVKQYFNFQNSALSALYYGDESYLVNAPTATSTLVGKMIRIEDSTILGNTVRGLEVQAHRGTNTKGENTGIAGYGRTFGLKGTTEGDAGEVVVPAGIFAETRGTTQGNALRAYSGSITTEDLVALFHDTSAFSGTGLQMNFGNSGGSFSGTSAKFLDFQVSGTSKFTVTAQGTTTIGDGTTANMAGLQIGYGGLCVDNDGSCTASTTGRITSVSSASGNSDLAEMYFSSDSLETGEIVSLTGGLSIGSASVASADSIIGVVSTKPGLLMGFDDVSLTPSETAYPVALKGRVPVKLSTENGPIQKGDRIALSSIPGVGMKAKDHSTVVGIAMEDWDGERAYSPAYLNQFGDDLVKARMQPLNQNTDARTQDGCSYGGGTENGSTPCVKDTVGTIKPGIVSVDTKTVAMRELEEESATTTRTEEGQEVAIGQAIMFVHLTEFFPESELLVLSELVSTSTVMNGNGTETLWDRVKALAQNFVDGVLTLTGLKADKVETSELCVDGVCVTADDLRALLEGVREGNSVTEEEPPAEPEPTPSEPTDTTPTSDEASPSPDVTDGINTGGYSEEIISPNDTQPVVETPPEPTPPPTEEPPMTEPTPELLNNETISP